MANTKTTGEALVEFDAVYIKPDGKMGKSDADAAATMPVITLCKSAALDPDEVGEFYQLGDEITNAGWSWTKGGLIYADTAAGGLTQTAPTGVGDQVQIVGIATAATKMFFWPSLEVKEVTA